MRLPVTVLAGAACLLFAGCAAVERPIGAELVQTCKDPRPEVCTMQYEPVCAYLEKSSGNPRRKQYSNACGACADSRVTGYISGPCPERGR